MARRETNTITGYNYAPTLSLESRLRVKELKLDHHICSSKKISELLEHWIWNTVVASGIITITTVVLSLVVLALRHVFMP